MARTGMTLETVLAAVGRVHRAGVRLVSGADAEITPTKPPGILPEASSNSSAPAEALGSVTSVAARACGLRDRKGRLRAGMTPTCCWSTGTRWRTSVRCALSPGWCCAGR
jgi:imidazolonepropionase-like amidohydrolase